ncbi:MAG: class I SAM-dependent methyltransferase [Verrucomicrobiaceae bacterium]|nr:class I SAM-dependent methyltransferase [Verrucomicrobiaceae bacterium]
MSRPSDDSQAALETLVYALEQQPQLLEGAERIAFLRAQPHEAFSHLRPKLICDQSYKPRADRLQAAGFKMGEVPESSQDVVLLMPDRQKDQTLASLARGLDLLADGGTLVVSLHNDWGAKRFQKALAGVTGAVEMLSKHHCRVFWAQKSAKCDSPELAEWRQHGVLRRVLDGKYWSLPGLFSWDRIDEGSALLVKHLPDGLHGSVADLGAGWGYLSEQLLLKCPEVTSLDCYEADRDALEPLRRNLGNLPVKLRPRVLWHDVAGGIDRQKYDVIVTNPPFHEGRAADPHLGGKFIAAAATGLRSHGHLWLVANRQLPYEHLLDEAFNHVRKVTEEGLYKVLHAHGPKDWVHRKHRR